MQSFTGRFWARLWDLDCVLELHSVSSGKVTGSFSADGEALEVTGAVANSRGAVSGSIRARNLSDLFARFYAQPRADGAFLEVVLTNPEGQGADDSSRACFERLF